MTRYFVRFYKNLLSSDGHPFKCLQTQIDVNDAADAAQAGRLASNIFQADHRICDWQLHADTREVVAAEPSADAEPDHFRRRRPAASFHDVVRALQKRAGRHQAARPR